MFRYRVHEDGYEILERGIDGCMQGIVDEISRRESLGIIGSHGLGDAIQVDREAT